MAYSFLLYRNNYISHFTKWQITGSWLIILTSWIGPILPFQTSAALIFSCLLAVTLLGYHHLLQGIGASLAYLITHTTSTYIVQSAMNTTDSLLMLMTLGVFCLAGSLLHWTQLKTESNNQLARSKYQQQVAISLHDKTCNNLTYAIRFIDERIYSNSQLSQTDLTELQDILRETLTQTRATISQLIDDDYSKDTQQADNSDQFKHLNQIISRAQHRLKQLQFRGEIINTLQELNHLPKKKTPNCFSTSPMNCFPTSSNMPTPSKATSSLLEPLAAISPSVHAMHRGMTPHLSPQISPPPWDC